MYFSDWEVPNTLGFEMIELYEHGFYLNYFYIIKIMFFNWLPKEICSRDIVIYQKWNESFLRLCKLAKKKNNEMKFMFFEIF